MLVLAGDIGGTNARLALVDTENSTRIVADRTGPSQEIGDLTEFIASFLSESGQQPERACLAVAGPVAGETVTGTNLPWNLEAGQMRSALEIPALQFINDFEAVGHGLDRLDRSDLETLQEGEEDPAGTIGIIGAGTGLGEGLVVRIGEHRKVVPSEGGHATFSPRDQRTWALFSFLASRYGDHVSWERVVSGPGLVDLFEFVSSGRESAEQIVLRKEMGLEDPAAVIARHGLAGTDRLAREALDLFIECYGAQSGNLALTVLATGGLYLAGGIARKIAGRMADGGFIDAFLDKGRMRGLLSRMPVRVILNPDVGLLGAASVAASW